MRIHQIAFVALITAAFGAPAASANGFAAADCFAPIIDGKPHPGCPEKINFLDDPPMQIEDFKKLLAGVWRLGHSCSGLPIPMERFLGKNINAGQSARMPIVGMSFGEDGTYNSINFGVFGNAPLQPDLGEILMTCQYSVEPASNGFFLITCPERTWVHLKPVRVKENDGEWVLRTGEVRALTPYICPAETELFGVYSRAPGF